MGQSHGGRRCASRPCSAAGFPVAVPGASAALGTTHPTRCLHPGTRLLVPPPLPRADPNGKPPGPATPGVGGGAQQAGGAGFQGGRLEEGEAGGEEGWLPGTGPRAAAGTGRRLRWREAWNETLNNKRCRVVPAGRQGLRAMGMRSQPAAQGCLVGRSLPPGRVEGGESGEVGAGGALGGEQARCFCLLVHAQCDAPKPRHSACTEEGQRPLPCRADLVAAPHLRDLHLEPSEPAK